MIILNNYIFLVVTIGSILLGIMASIVGSFAVLKNESLLSDAIGHSSLLGVGIAFIIFHTKDLPYLVIGALISGIFLMYFLKLITNNSRITNDSSISILLTTFFGMGLLALTYISTLKGANKAGLNRFIFGQAATIQLSDIKFMLYISVIIIIVLLILMSKYKILIFDKVYAQSIGINVKFYDYLFSFILVVTTIVGVQVVGAILITGFIITPSVIGRMWTKKFERLILISSFLGALSAFLGTLISFILEDIPTGPAIVVVLSLMLIFSLLFSPNGILSKKIKFIKSKNEISKKFGDK